MNKAEALGLLSVVFLFLLISGISASVDTDIFKSRFKSMRGIMIGLFCQFFLLPFMGFASAKAFDLDPVYGITLLAVTCSPGGAFSNWWCSLFNADLALSVAMTTVSTLASVVMMPLNLYLYIRGTYGESVSLNWIKLIISISIALIAIIFGIVCSAKAPEWRNVFNVGGNLAGVGLIALGVFTSSRDDPLWDKEAVFYIAVALPCFAGLAAAFLLATLSGLKGPERISVTVETCYQNTGIALTLALATFPEDQQSKAAGVPLYYGVVEIILLPIFLAISWKLGLTYAPRKHSLVRVLAFSYQPGTKSFDDLGAIEDPDLKHAHANPRLSTSSDSATRKSISLTKSDARWMHPDHGFPCSVHDGSKGALPAVIPKE